MATSWLSSLACTTGRAPVCSTRCAGNAIKSDSLWRQSLGWELACVEFSSYSMEEAMYNKLKSLNTWYFSSTSLWPVPSLLSFSFGISKESIKSVGYPEQPAANTRALIGVFSATHETREAGDASSSDITVWIYNPILMPKRIPKLMAHRTI